MNKKTNEHNENRSRKKGMKKKKNMKHFMNIYAQIQLKKLNENIGFDDVEKIRRTIFEYILSDLVVKHRIIINDFIEH